MNVTRGLAAKALVALAIVCGVPAASLAGGATSPHVAAHAPRAISVSAVKKYTFKATYHGTISILWSSSGKTIATITGKGSGVDLGFTSISGSGSVIASSQSDPINGAGVLVGKGRVLHLKLSTNSEATAAGSAAPTVVTVSGFAIVTKGAGAFANATGKLTVSGEFSIQGTSGKEKDSFSATLKGVVTVK